VADHHAVGSAREATVGHHADLVAEALSDDRRGRGEHLAHPRAATRPFVADHDHLARANAIGEDRLEARLLGLEDPRGPADARHLETGDLGHGALGGEVAAQDRQVAARVDRAIEGAHHVLIRRRRVGDGGEVLRHRLAGDGQA
jgi:hypothetical protein